eukprot:TRINITY_DN3185_c0_g1_i2.p1 TRINITY_DN3185_c0_g1~~TRINITY_DN3185_c0_g1_i2.p1  ORF type:complete len:485 (-),score=120.92 TRINITY_DN3185_c0_g1_i2:448-1902(-)
MEMADALPPLPTESIFSLEDTVSDADPIKKSLLLNRQYQELISREMTKLQQAMHRNSELQKRIRSIISLKPTRKVSQAKKPLFADADGNTPSENQDTISRRQALGNIPSVFLTKKWTQEDVDNLTKGVVNQNLERMVEDLKKQYANDTTLKEFTDAIAALKKTPDEEIARDCSTVDWERLAEIHCPGRTGMECKLRWTCHESPTINYDDWTNEEEQKLLDVIKVYKGNQWNAIAKELGTNRTAIQCLQKFQRELNPAMIKGRWTEEEDAALVNAVKQFGDKNWSEVAHCIEGRTGQQCLHRYQKTLNPTIRRGRWTEEEDKMLSLAAREMNGRHWVKISQHVPGRTDVQCRERYMNILSPELNTGPWTPEEDKLLIAAVEEHGEGKWSQIAKSIPSRTDNHCWRRWKIISPQHKKRRAAASLAGKNAKKPRTRKTNKEKEAEQNKEQNTTAEYTRESTTKHTRESTRWRTRKKSTTNGTTNSLT